MNLFLNIDCMDEDKGICSYPDNYFDLAIVDPPYGINVSHNIGKRAGMKSNDYKKVNWDDSVPNSFYFEEITRVSKNQIIWGGNYFTKFLPPTNSWIIWHKMNDGVSFPMAEMAWTSFDFNCKVIKRYNDRGKGRTHPTQKPIWLYDYCLTSFAKKGDLILDTHVGSASSLISFQSMNFNYVGFEIDKDYYKIALNRISKGIEKKLF